MRTIKKLVFLFKDPGSGNGSCPAFYRTDTGDYAVQGWKLADADVRAQVRDLADNEDVVVIPAALVERLREG